MGYKCIGVLSLLGQGHTTCNTIIGHNAQDGQLKQQRDIESHVVRDQGKSHDQRHDECPLKSPSKSSAYECNPQLCRLSSVAEGTA